MHQDVIYRGRFNWIQTVTGVFQNNYVDRIKRSNHHLLSSMQRCQLWLSYFLLSTNKVYFFSKLGIFDLKIKLLSMIFGKALPCNIEEVKFVTLFFIMFLLPKAVCSLEELTWSSLKGEEAEDTFGGCIREGIDRDTLLKNVEHVRNTFRFPQSAYLNGYN